MHFPQSMRLSNESYLSFLRSRYAFLSGWDPFVKIRNSETKKQSIGWKWPRATQTRYYVLIRDKSRHPFRCVDLPCFALKGVAFNGVCDFNKINFALLCFALLSHAMLCSTLAYVHLQCFYLRCFALLCIALPCLAVLRRGLPCLACFAL